MVFLLHQHLLSPLQNHELVCFALTWVSKLAKAPAFHSPTLCDTYKGRRACVHPTAQFPIYRGLSHYLLSLFRAGFKASPEELTSHRTPCRQHSVLCSLISTQDASSSFSPRYEVAALPKKVQGAQTHLMGLSSICVCGFLEASERMWKRV